ncbi:Tyr recombinase domain-containing protein [uncultured Thiomicrorhabdus sp.]
MALTETAIKKLTAKERRYRKTDSNGLLIEVLPTGRKVWRYRYRFNEKQGAPITLGDYSPSFGLTAARAKRDELKAVLDSGRDPKAYLDEIKQTHIAEAKELEHKEQAKTFSQLFEEFAQFKTSSIGGNKSDWSYDTLHKHQLRLKNHVMPMIGDTPIEDLTEMDLERVLMAIQEHGTLANRNKVHSLFKLIFRFAKGKRYIARNIALELNTDGFIKHTPKHFKHVTKTKDLAKLVRDLSGISASFEVKQCLHLAINIFSRPSEVARLKWSQVDFESGLIDLEITKISRNNEPMILQTPMSTQVRELLETMQPLTAGTDYVFCTPYGGRNAPINRDSLSNALRNNGIDSVSPHGFRHTASTALNNLGFEGEEVEIQLSHTIKGTRGVYNSADKLQQRKRLLQAWSDYLDGLRNGADVVPIHQNKQG